MMELYAVAMVAACGLYIPPTQEIKKDVSLSFDRLLL